MKCNYHTHTQRCHHAVGLDAEYPAAALEAGFDELGMADHTPWPFISGYVSNIRMLPDELPAYVDTFRRLREEYSGRLSIHIGVEAEWFPRYRAWYDRMRDKGVEYFILGQHFVDSEEDTLYVGQRCRTDDGVKAYADSVCEAAATGLFRYICHPDLFMRQRDGDFNKACEEATLNIAQAAREANIPLEYNLLGYSLIKNGQGGGYPCPEFWDLLRGKGNSVILGVDAHNPAALKNTALWDEGKANLLALGFEPVDHLDF